MISKMLWDAYYYLFASLEFPNRIAREVKRELLIESWVLWRLWTVHCSCKNLIQLGRCRYCCMKCKEPSYPWRNMGCGHNIKFLPDLWSMLYGRRWTDGTTKLCLASSLTMPLSTHIYTMRDPTLVILTLWRSSGKSFAVASDCRSWGLPLLWRLQKQKSPVTSTDLPSGMSREIIVYAALPGVSGTRSAPREDKTARLGHREVLSNFLYSWKWIFFVILIVVIAVEYQDVIIRIY